MIKKVLFVLLTSVIILVTSPYAYAQNSTAIDFFYFQTGGFSEGRTALCINGTTGEAISVWSQSFPEDMTQEKLEDFIKEEKDYVKVKRATLTQKQLKAFEKELLSCKVTTWNSKYINKDIMDGTEWKLQIIFKDKTQLKSVGINKFPKQWEQFKKAVTKHI